MPRSLVSFWKRVATSGTTADGREILPQELRDIAETYKPSKYTAVIWCDHERWSGSHGTVYAVRLVEEGDDLEEGQIALEAQLKPNDRLLYLNDQGQKLFTSIEITPNFAGSGKAYLTGLGVTDEPASLGTQELYFSKKTHKDAFYAASVGVAEDALTALNQKSLEFSVAYGENARDFVASAYTIEGAIKGLTGNQLATFTNTSNLLAKATKSDAETMGAYVGTMYNLFKGQADAMGKGEWVEKLGGQTALAVQLFRTDGAQLKDAFKEVGSIATAAGVDIAEQFAVIGSLSSTMEGGDAGGRYKAFFENLGAASEKMGVKFTDSNGKALPMLQIMEKLQGKLGDLTSASANTKLMEAFGGEGAQVITSLAKDTDRLRNGMDKLGKVRGLEDAENMAKAMVDPWQQFGAAVEGLRIAFGQALIPILTPLMAKLSGIAGTMTRWTQMFPNITRVIGIVTLTILALIAVMSLLTFAVGAGRMAWLAMVTVWKVVQMISLRTTAVFLLQKLMMLTYITVIALLSVGLGLVSPAALWPRGGRS